MPQNLTEEELKPIRREGEKEGEVLMGETTDGCQGVKAFGPISGVKGLKEEWKGDAGLGKRMNVSRREVLYEESRGGRRRWH